MKKIIYPIVAALVLSGFSAFAQTIPAGESRNKPFITYHFHSQFSSLERADTIADHGSHDTGTNLSTELTRVDMVTPFYQSSDEQIDRQFNREETTIELFSNSDGDFSITSQFYRENGPAIALKAK